MNDINKKYEITHPQKRIWYNEMLFPNTPMHNITSKMHVGGNVDISLMEKAINLIIEKNDSLRLKFCEEYEKIYQYVADYSFIEIPFLDFSSYNYDAEKKFKEFCENEGEKILYKENELLFKFFIYKINNEKFGIYFVIHHLIFDGMSCNLILNQLGNIYERLCNGEFVNSNPENSYIHFIDEEKDYLNSKEFKKNKQFWNEKFLNLNENSLYINSKSTKSKSKSFPLSDDMCIKVKSFLNEHKISLNRFFISVSSIYINKILNENDITIAVACFNRSTERQKNTVGMFTGTMPLRINLDDNSTYSEFLNYINTEIKSCYTNQKYPYDLLVQDLELKKKGFDSLFKLCVNYYVVEGYALGDSSNRYIYNEQFLPKYSNVPLHMFLKEFKKDGSIELETHYRINDYNEKQIIQMVKSIKCIINEIINDSNIKLSEIQTVTEKEKNIILKEFNNTKKDYAKNKTISELFEEIVENVQDKIAVVSNGAYLTYRELNERANQLGNLLIKKGIKKESIVPILCDKSIDTIISMLAIIKSGAAYLPIDEDYPESRIKYMLEDSNSKILLIKKHQLEKINLEKINIELIDLNNEGILKENKQNIKNINSPEDLAYVIYTSGSTGKPKGVCIESKSLINLVNNPDYIKIEKNDKVLQAGSLSFDASVFQIWIALLNGITLHLEDKTLIINDTELENYIDKNKITIMLMPTALFNQYSENNIEIFRNLKYLISGGDVLSSKQVSKITKAYKNLKILNAYGPTENTVISTVYEVNDEWNENIAVPIGTPISNSTAYIMDKNNNLLPIGVVGELCVGGDGIAREYLNREELTKEKFIENPYVKGERIYKTGDLAKWLADGNIHFIGRIDHQVKISGFRIELEEIESQLLKYPKLTEVAVIDKKVENGNKYLCAYVVSEEKISLKGLKDFLKKELPNYMIPSHIMQLKNMPINCNGKIDRKALPIPDLSQNDIEFIEPRNKIEKKLHAIWCKLLNIKKISVKDNFFELGGNSLIAINLVSKIHKEIKLKIAVTDIFNMPSIEELAIYLNNIALDNKNNFHLNFKEIEKAPKADYYEASAVQKRIYAINQTNIDSTNYNIPIAYVINGDFDKYRFEKAICDLINRHEALRTSFHIINGEIFQKIHSKINFKVKCVKINRKFDKNKFQVDKFIKPFDLSEDTLIHTCIIEFFDISILIIDIHHIISDGVSIGILIKELSSLYNQEKLDKLNIQYKDFSNWQNRLYKNGLLEIQEKYWLDRFKGELPVLNMTSDYRKISSQNFEGNTIDFQINEDLTSKINKNLNNLGITKFMFYLAAYNVLLYKYTDQKDLIIGTPTAGRTHEDLKGTVGMFVNTLPLRNKIKQNMSFKELLTEVKNNSLKAFENQDYDLKNLIDKLNMKKQSLFDVIFSFQNVTINTLSFENTKISTYKLKNNISKFDISMTLKEDNEKISCLIEYKTSLYKKETMERFAKHYVNILTSVIENLDNPIDTINILSQDEKDVILNKFNNTKKEYPKNKTISELFEEVVEYSQDKIAVVSNGSYLTYIQLNERANQIANLLRKKGITKNSIVPILCDKSLDTIIGILAIIKSGGAYLAIDEDYPKPRIKYMIEDVNGKLILGKKELLNKFDFNESNIELINYDNEQVLKESTHNLQRINTTEDLIYVMYTSGSTGKPKGVCIKQKNVIRLIKNTNFIEFKEDDRIFQTGSIAFDASTFEVWGSLLNGKQLFIESKDIVLNPTLLENYLKENKITICWFTAPLFNQLCKENINLFKPLRYLLTGGDVVSSVAVSKLKKIHSNLIIIDGYGPTENTTFSTTYTIDGQWDENIQIPIGKPIANSTAYILNKNNNLLPIGVPGELCLGGDGVANGYLNRQKLTNEKFVQNPYVSNEIIYKTGDLARWLPDGNIEFIGRIDRQVKISGFRIELGEIEKQLLKHSNVNEGAVIDIKDENNNKYLCAYFVGDISTKELMNFLKKDLPSYMIPTYIVQLETMPLTFNGKIDKKALPAPDLSNLNEEYIAPKNDIEEKISIVWSKILGINNISIDSNFFEIGGNSLKAISVVSKLSKQFTITINDIFKYPTIQELALNIKNIKENLWLKLKEVQDVVAITEVQDDDKNPNMIPQSIKSFYDSYINSIEKYKNLNLNNETLYKNILLTGASGYVGINILKELIFSTNSKVHILLRGKNIKQAEERIIQKIAFYFGQDFYPKYKNRINILIGDISKDYLGLDLNTYEKFSLEIDCVINAAANVKHYGRYEDFYNVNVLGTKHLLDFAEKGLIKDFNQISTMSVGNGTIVNKNLVMFSESDIDLGQESDNVYAHSKLEAEKLVEKAGINSLNTKIFRLGNVTFNYETGLFQENITENAFYKNIKSFAKLNCIPKIKGNTLDFSYVDQLSKAIILLFNKKNLKNEVFHIVNPRKISTSDLAQLLKIKYKNIEIKNMNNFLSYISSKGEDEELREYVDNIKVNFRLLEHDNLTTFVTVNERTNAILNKLGFQWSKLDKAAVQRMLDYCEKVKFL